MSEKDLHPKLVEFLIKEKKCIAARKELGHSFVGKADAFGIKDIGGRIQCQSHSNCA